MFHHHLVIRGLWYSIVLVQLLFHIYYWYDHCCDLLLLLLAAKCSWTWWKSWRVNFCDLPEENTFCLLFKLRQGSASICTQTRDLIYPLNSSGSLGPVPSDTQYRRFLKRRHICPSILFFEWSLMQKSDHCWPLSIMTLVCISGCTKAIWKC